MNEDEVRQKLRRVPSAIQDEDDPYVPESWPVESFRLQQLPNGDWLAARPELPSEGIVIKSDGEAFPFFGALGKLVPTLGLPVSRELLLGSAQRGRYQLYERGLAIWEEFENGSNLGYPVASWETPQRRAKKCRALVAFFDLRGFTQWSASGVDAEQIQDVVVQLELSFQDAFSGKWCEKLFAKSTGDGFMVVSEEGWDASGGIPSASGFQHGHVKKFCRACALTVENAGNRLPAALAVGCGITTGEITQLYVLGRLDYTGPAVNEASKIQGVAYDELCISPQVMEHLQADGVVVNGKLLPEKGVRIAVENLLRK